MRAVVINTPNDPAGRVLTSAELEGLAAGNYRRLGDSPRGVQSRRPQSPASGPEPRSLRVSSRNRAVMRS
jgi:hypothetical protein